MDTKDLMPYSKDLDRYPIALFRPIEDILRNGTPEIPIPCESEKEAWNLRTRFYGLRFAIRHPDNNHPLKNEAGKVQFKPELRDGQWYCVAYHLEDTASSRELDERVLNAIEASRHKSA